MLILADTTFTDFQIIGAFTAVISIIGVLFKLLISSKDSIVTMKDSETQLLLKAKDEEIEGLKQLKDLYKQSAVDAIALVNSAREKEGQPTIIPVIAPEQNATLGKEINAAAMLKAAVVLQSVEKK